MSTAKLYQEDALSVLLGNARFGDPDDSSLEWFEVRADGVHVRDQLDIDEQTIDDITGDTQRRRKRGPLLPLPFTMLEFLEFEQMTGLLGERLNCGEDTAELIAKKRALNSEAGELAEALALCFQALDVRDTSGDGSNPPKRARRDGETITSWMGQVDTGYIDGVSDADRRLARLRLLGGDAEWRTNKWRFKGVAKLVHAEEKDQRQRASEKTIRADLIRAANKEREAARAGKPPSIFPQ